MATDNPPAPRILLLDTAGDCDPLLRSGWVRPHSRLQAVKHLIDTGHIVLAALVEAHLEPKQLSSVQDYHHHHKNNSLTLVGCPTSTSTSRVLRDNETTSRHNVGPAGIVLLTHLFLRPFLKIHKRACFGYNSTKHTLLSSMGCRPPQTTPPTTNIRIKGPERPKL